MLGLPIRVVNFTLTLYWPLELSIPYPFSNENFYFIFYILPNIKKLNLHFGVDQEKFCTPSSDITSDKIFSFSCILQFIMKLRHPLEKLSFQFRDPLGSVPCYFGDSLERNFFHWNERIEKIIIKFHIILPLLSIFYQHFLKFEKSNLFWLCYTRLFTAKFGYSIYFKYCYKFTLLKN